MAAVTAGHASWRFHLLNLNYIPVGIQYRTMCQKRNKFNYILTTMALRDKENTQLDKSWKDQQKAMLRLLESCKQIPKDDRLELRTQLKTQNNDLISLFRSFKKVLQSASSLQNLQIALRRYLVRWKQEKEEEMLRTIREPVSPQKKMKLVMKSKTQSRCQTPIGSASKKRPWWFQKLSKSTEKSVASKEVSGFKSPEIQASLLQSPVPAPTPESLNTSQNITVNPYFFTSQTPKVAQPKLPTSNNENCFDKIPAITVTKPQDSIFTNPKMLQQCQNIIRQCQPHPSPPIIYTPYQPKVPFSILKPLKQHLLFLRGRDAQDIISWLFPDTAVIPKPQFLQRMHSYMQLQLAPTHFNIEEVFEMVSTDGQRVFVGEMGKVVDELCLQSLTNTEVRIMFSRLVQYAKEAGHTAPTGRLGRGLFASSQWVNLYDKVQQEKVNHVGYWEMYSAGRTWEYMSFAIWFKEKHNMSTFRFEGNFFDI